MVRFTIDNRKPPDLLWQHGGSYVKDDAAVVDEMFQTDELSHYLARLNLTPQWKEGVFDRLAAGEAPGEELGQPQKGCRIWQLRKGVDVTMRFIGYEDLIKRFGEPDADNYTQVFDGDLGTNDLEQIYAICRDSPPPGYQGLPDGSVRCGGAVR
ncbi:MAG: YodL domain-containing protein [Oscillospiraceae bacterium]